MNRDELARVVAIAKEHLPEFLAKYAKALEGKQGLFFIACYGKVSMGEMLMEGGVLGHLTDEKEPRYMLNAMEKITRIKTRQNNHFSDCTSFPSADNKTTWGGAIHPEGTQWYLSSSALPPEYDHLFNIEVAMKAGIINQEQADKLNAEIPKEIWEKMPAHLNT